MPVEFDSGKLKSLFREVGLYNPKGEFYTARVRKHKQVFAYIEQIQAAFNKLSTKRPIVVVDCGCGKSYLSFILYEYCHSVLDRKIKIIGVDNNPELIEKCQNIADEMGFEHMKFFARDVSSFETDEEVDIVYSLHACNTATDQTIAAGIRLQSKYILSVSCCQHRNRKLMRGHPLTSISRYRPYKERLVDMVGDTMRGLLLEHMGYGVSLFEFVAMEQTPKNVMLRAINNSVKKLDRVNAMTRYKELVDMFNFAPALEVMISEDIELVI